LEVKKQNENSTQAETDVAVSGDSEVGTDKNASLYTTARMNEQIIFLV
jgi:hypothetical protein